MKELLRLDHEISAEASLMKELLMQPHERIAEASLMKELKRIAS